MRERENLNRTGCDTAGCHGMTKPTNEIEREGDKERFWCGAWYGRDQIWKERESGLREMRVYQGERKLEGIWRMEGESYNAREEIRVP